jgi:hypothetical protein
MPKYSRIRLFNNKVDLGPSRHARAPGIDFGGTIVESERGCPRSRSVPAGCAAVALRKMEDRSAKSYVICAGKFLHVYGVKRMDKLVEIRNQELICRERALSDPDRRVFWLMRADEWAQRALDEITFQLVEDRFTGADTQARSGESRHA